MRFIRESFEAAHLAFTPVADRFRALLAAAVSEHERELAEIPRLSGHPQVVKDSIEIAVDPTPNMKEGWGKTCALRASGAAATDDGELHAIDLLDDRCAAKRGRFTQDHFEYRLCWSMNYEVDLCEPYTQARLEERAPERDHAGH
jgi:hypothetical protein